ncbi:MAG: hypothetical protein ACI814_004039, partial [Mariniblastus sp.]
AESDCSHHFRQASFTAYGSLTQPSASLLARIDFEF